MRFAKIPFIRNTVFGLLALLATCPLIYAQRFQQSDRGESTSKGEPGFRGESAPRSEAPTRIEPVQRIAPVRAPVERAPIIVDRPDHGSIRHVDTHVVERPVMVRHDTDVRVRVSSHHDVEVDFRRPRFWHDFTFGRRMHTLRVGYMRIFVNNAPFYYDDGIFYQPVGDDYQEVYPPVGAIVQILPDGAIEIDVGDTAYYYAGGAFFVQRDDGFVIVPPPMGVVVPELPPGAVQISSGNSVVYQFNGIYYQPVFVNGVSQYMTFLH